MLPPKESIRVLLVEDNPGDVRLLEDHLSHARPNRFYLTCVTRLSAGLDSLCRGDYELILLDLSLPDSHGTATLVQMHRAAKDLPIVVLTNIEDEALGVKLIQAGAQDYLVKGHITMALLSRSLLYAT